MANIKINYIEISDLESNSNCLIREYDIIDKTSEYNRCPVFKHKKTRTFIGTSPIDYFLSYDKKINSLECTDLSKISSLPNNKDNDFVLQLNFPNYFFWTEAPDVWMSYDPYPLTSLNNNFIVIDGWFNLSNWSRGTSFSVKIIDENKPVVINRGDPLFKICFITSNLNDGIILNKISNKKHPKYLEYMNRNREEWRGKLFSASKKEKKCPFSFLFN